jgi:hypothetical protein
MERQPRLEARLRQRRTPRARRDRAPFANVERLAPEEIARRRAEFDQPKARARRLREPAGTTPRAGDLPG